MTNKETKQNTTTELNRKTNWLRAAVLGANDGIVSIAGLVVGVAGATSDKLIILTAGVAGILAGAISMAVGEYVSVSTQRDVEEEHHKNHSVEQESAEDAIFTNPWHAAIASATSFLVGSLIPFIAVMLPLGSATIPVTFAAVIVALVLTGYLSAKFGGANKRRAILRVVVGGTLAMLVTHIIGALFGVAIA